MTFGEDWGWGASQMESRKMFDRFAEAGGNFIDTSVNYTDGTSETFLGDFLKADRDHFVVATKYTLTRPDQTDPNQGGNSRKNMQQSVERSLKRLQTDVIDLLYLHMWDFMTPLDEMLRGLDDLVRQGKVLYVAFSDTPAWIVAEANTRAELHGWARPVALQAPYSLRNRSIERAELEMARYWDMAVMAFGILGGGTLTGKYATGSGEPTRYDIKELPQDLARLVAELQAVASEVGRTPSQVAINWILAQRHRANIIPILGARTLTQLEDNLGTLGWSLEPEQARRLSEASPIDLGFPLGWLKGAREYVYGATYDQIDNHRGNPVHYSE
jgi:aryl-alcohol dehydrogenase-like predicted oxidoreductase